MNLKNKPPVFVPAEHRAEIEKLSKAALMDMVWDYAKQIAAHDHATSLSGKSEDEGAMDEFRRRREIIMTYRNQAPDHLADIKSWKAQR